MTTIIAQKMEKIVKKLKIKISRDKAYEKFVHELNKWWPKEYTWSQNELEEIKIDAKTNGLCTEIGPYGFRCDWGRVTALTKNKKIELKWQISPERQPIPNPLKASDIKIIFMEDGEMSTNLELVHYNFQNHGAGGEEYKEMMFGEKGWDYILNNYQQYCER